MLKSGALILALVLSVVAPASSETLERLSLPQGFTLGRMAAGGNAIAATISTARIGVTRVVVWRGGIRSMLVLPSAPQHGNPNGTASESLDAVGQDGVVYASASYPFSGAYIGDDVLSLAYRTPASSKQLRFPSCGMVGELQVSAEDGFARAVNFVASHAGTAYNFSDAWEHDGEAPLAAIVNLHSCTSLGKGYVTAIRGRYSAGFRRYLGDSIVPSDVCCDSNERFVALRWMGGRLDQLGSGLALGITINGDAVGATRLTNAQSVNPGLPNSFTFSNGAGPGGAAPVPDAQPLRESPQALMWLANKKRIMIAPNSAESVAYAIDEDNRVIGSMKDHAGHHFAFLWRQGKLQRLDDIVRHRGWRFEAAYAFTASGGIVGAGTYNGIATGFVLRL